LDPTLRTGTRQDKMHTWAQRPKAFGGVKEQATQAAHLTTPTAGHQGHQRPFGQAQRLASRRSYGHGIGALCALWVRRGDRFAAKMLLGWVRVQFRGILRAGLDRNWLMMRQRFLALQGCALGFAYGMKTAEGAIQPEAQRVP